MTRNSKAIFRIWRPKVTSKEQFKGLLPWLSFQLMQQPCFTFLFPKGKNPKINCLYHVIPTSSNMGNTRKRETRLIMGTIIMGTIPR